MEAAKQDKRRLERKWKKSKLEIEHHLYSVQCHTHQQLLTNAETYYYQQRLYVRDDKELFRLIDKYSSSYLNRYFAEPTQ